MPKSVEIFSWNDLQKIGKGVDSHVYLRGDQVLKRYYPGISLPTIERYKELTNRAARFLSENPYEVRGNPGYGRKDIDSAYYEIVPIDWIRVDQSNRVVTASRYVPGPNFLSMRLAVNMWEEYLVQLGEDEQRILEKVKVAIQTGYFTPNFKALGLHLEAYLPTQGINIELVNVKVRFNTEAQRLSFIVTDLAGNLSLIRSLGIK